MPESQESTVTLVSHWRIEASVEEVAEVLRDVERFPDWWGDVYLDVRILEEGDAEGIGRIAWVHTKGRLPYTLQWTGRVVEAERPHRWVIDATGDLKGRGIWTLRQNGPVTEAVYEWRVYVSKPTLRILRPLLRPVFAANHRWAMARGLEGLRAELTRRRMA